MHREDWVFCKSNFKKLATSKILNILLSLISLVFFHWFFVPIFLRALLPHLGLSPVSWLLLPLFLPLLFQLLFPVFLLHLEFFFTFNSINQSSSIRQDMKEIYSQRIPGSVLDVDHPIGFCSEDSIDINRSIENGDLILSFCNWLFGSVFSFMCSSFKIVIQFS